ncbi:MAG: cytochrome c3 family protein [Gemmatimonadaceae bacterium]
MRPRSGRPPPPHVEPAFSPNCTLCHTTTTCGWETPRADAVHPDGAHRAVKCADCHADKVYHGKNMECVSCHQKDYNGTTNPPHSQGFPTTCTTCHNTVRWQDATFDHSQMTKFALTGAHRTLACIQCHGDKTYKGRSMECVSCHQGAYDKTVSPKHVAAGFNTRAARTCHTTVQRKGAPFDHNAQTKFALTGAHRAATCVQCHADDVYRGKSMLCVSCHQTDYNASKIPPHASAGFHHLRASCHTTVQWKGAAFDHNTTQFPLTGAHKAALCMDCHADNVFKGKPMTCVSCHQKDYDTAKIPPHGARPGSRWFANRATPRRNGKAGSSIITRLRSRSPANTRTASCASCHADGVYVGKPTACESCHLDKYNATTNPNHKQAGFLSTCVACHTTKDWVGTPFDHAKTNFPLTATPTSTKAACVRTATETGYTTASPRRASAATRPSTPVPRTRPTHRPGFPPRARRATIPRSGPARCSITTRRTSR